MPQEFQVLRCYNCEKFQVHQVKKAKKWDCKVCGEKQSYIKVYFTGSAKECRLIVQKFNFDDGERKISQMLMKNSIYNSENHEEYNEQFTSEERIHKRFKSENLMDSAEDYLEVDSIPLKQEDSNPNIDPLIRTIFESATTVSDNELNYKFCASTDISETSTFISDESSLQRDKNKDMVLKVSNQIRPTRVKNVGFQKILVAAKGQVNELNL